MQPSAHFVICGLRSCLDQSRPRRELAACFDCLEGLSCRIWRAINIYQVPILERLGRRLAAQPHLVSQAFGLLTAGTARWAICNPPSVTTLPARRDFSFIGAGTNGNYRENRRPWGTIADRDFDQKPDRKPWKTPVPRKFEPTEDEVAQLQVPDGRMALLLKNRAAHRGRRLSRLPKSLRNELK